MTVQVQRPRRKASAETRPARGRRKWLLLMALCLAGLAWAWLGRLRSDARTLVPVEGQVLVNGRPLEYRDGQIGKVWFYPDQRQPHPCPDTPSGDIDAEGRFTLSTRGKPGVPPGRYWAMLIATRPTDSRRPFHRRQSLIPDRYCAVDTSGLMVDVTAEAPPGAYDLKLRK